MTAMAAFQWQVMRVQFDLNRVQPRLVVTRTRRVSAAMRSRNYTERALARRPAGICMECDDPARPGKAYCARCAERRARNQQRRREAARQAQWDWILGRNRSQP